MLQCWPRSYQPKAVRTASDCQMKSQLTTAGSGANGFQRFGKVDEFLEAVLNGFERLLTILFFPGLLTWE